MDDTRLLRPSPTLVTRWFSLPRLLRFVLLLPVVIAVQALLILLIYPTPHVQPLTVFSVFALVMLAGNTLLFTDFPNLAHQVDAPAPASFIVMVLNTLTYLALIAAFTLGSAWLYFDISSHLHTMDATGWRHAATALVAITIVVVGSCLETWIRLSAAPGSIPPPIEPITDLGSSAARSMERRRNWEHNERARERIGGLRQGTMSQLLLLLGMRVSLLCIAALPLAASTLLLLPLDPVHTAWAAGLCGLCVVLVYSVFTGFGRFTREEATEESGDAGE